MLLSSLECDLSSAIWAITRFGSNDRKPLEHFERNWDKLCDLDIEIAGALYHGVEQIQMAMARDGRVTEQQEREHREITGVIKIARDKHPDVKVETLSELIDLGERAIQDEIDDETKPTK